ncbi:MAG: aldose 1-epimerase family protein, partial [Clostridia bacterium]|nr:aldose 1-epimerase family protein [Clostridia bacterium]
MNFEVKNDKLSVSVKAHGAELSSVKSLDTGFEYLWQGNPDIWYGQSPVLFPIVGTLYQNKYYVDGKEYEMFRHGIARKRD